MLELISSGKCLRTPGIVPPPKCLDVRKVRTETKYTKEVTHPRWRCSKAKTTFQCWSLAMTCSLGLPSRRQPSKTHLETPTCKIIPVLETRQIHRTMKVTQVSLPTRPQKMLKRNDTDDRKKFILKKSVVVNPLDLV